MYIADYKHPLTTPHDKALVAFPMVALALLIGFIVGVLVWATLQFSFFLIDIVWFKVPDVIGAGVWFTPLVCAVGGIGIGAWNYFTGVTPKTLEEVMAQVKATGGYQLEGGLGKNIIGFLLPLTFGGSIGPEAGLTGIIAGACTWIGNRLKRAGVAAKSVVDLTLSASLSAIFGTPFLGIVATAEDGLPANEDKEASVDTLEFRRAAKIILYCSAAFGAFAGIMFVNAIVGESTGLPRFDAIDVHLAETMWFLPLVLGAYVLTLGYQVFEKGMSYLKQKWSENKYAEFFMPVLCGILLGLTALALPLIMFSGEKQATEIQTLWVSLPVVVLFGTALVKLFATSLCLNMGWHGGLIFPLIFSGVSAGYGFAALLGIDPMFCVAVCTTALVACIMRKPLMAVALVMLCFPIDDILWLGLAAILAASLPLPRCLQKRDADKSENFEATEQKEIQALDVDAAQDVAR